MEGYAPHLVLRQRGHGWGMRDARFSIVGVSFLRGWHGEPPDIPCHPFSVFKVGFDLAFDPSRERARHGVSVLPGSSQVGRDPHSGVDRSVRPSRVDRPVCLSFGAPLAQVPPALGIAHLFAPRQACRMTTAESTRAELALCELAEHMAAIERLSRAPFNAERIALHRSLALECLDAVATELAS